MNAGSVSVGADRAIPLCRSIRPSRRPSMRRSPRGPRARPRPSGSGRGDPCAAIARPARRAVAACLAPGRATSGPGRSCAQTAARPSCRQQRADAPPDTQTARSPPSKDRRLGRAGDRPTLLVRASSRARPRLIPRPSSHRDLRAARTQLGQHRRAKRRAVAHDHVCRADVAVQVGARVDLFKRGEQTSPHDKSLLQVQGALKEPLAKRYSRQIGLDRLFHLRHPTK